MLSSLHIENIAIIKTSDIDLYSGFTVLTGETGAGKSIIIDSISLLLGSRADKALIRRGEKEAAVSGMFSPLSAVTLAAAEEAGITLSDEVMLSRTLSCDGRSVCRIDGRQVPLSVYKNIAGTLINIHGQQDAYALLSPQKHGELLDAYTGKNTLKERYEECYFRYQRAKSALSSFLSKEKDKENEEEILSYRVKEISALKPKAGEEDSLRAERALLLNAERIEKQAGYAYRALSGGEKATVSSVLEKSAQSLSSLSDISEEYSDIAEKIREIRYQVEDISERISLISSGTDNSTDRLNRVEERLEKIDRLKIKYKCDEEGLVNILKAAKERLSEIENSEETEKELRREYVAAKTEALKAGDALSEARKEASEELSLAVCDVLSFLDMPKTKFSCAVEKSDALTPTGIDRVEFMLSQAGEEPMPLSKIASGGELSRVMLAVKSVFAEADGVSTIIYDEIDSGVSGKTARKIGIKLKESADGMQVLSITHSAQIASLADNHLRVEKYLSDDKYQSRTVYLDREGRIDELSRILGGINVTDAQRRAAIDMLDLKEE